MACPQCKNYMGRCGKCGADLNKATRSEPIGRPALPPRRPLTEGDNEPRGSR